MTTNLPNLYTAFDLDRSDDSEALGVVLSARDLRLEQMGITPNDPRRAQTVMAFSVLNDPAKRALYDEKLNAGLPLTWEQIQHLGNFGTIPEAPAAPTWQQTWQQQSTPPPRQAQQSSPPQNFGYNYGDPTTAPTHGAYNPFNEQVNSSISGTAFSGHAPMSHFSGATPAMNVERPTAGARLGMAWLDLIIFSIGSGILVALLGLNEFGAFVLGALLMVAYIVGFESVMGATPAKKFFGYEVRDVTTHSRLSAGASMKRNWWKFLSIIPPASIVTLVMAGVYGNQINEENQMRGGHDKLANAEVVKKS